MQPLAERTQSIKNYNGTQDESGAPWRTCSDSVKDEKSKEPDQSERKRVSESHHAGKWWGSPFACR